MDIGLQHHSEGPNIELLNLGPVPSIHGIMANNRTHVLVCVSISVGFPQVDCLKQNGKCISQC